MEMCKSVGNWRGHFNERRQREGMNLQELVERAETVVLGDKPEFRGDPIVLVIRCNESEDVAVTQGCRLVDLLLSISTKVAKMGSG